MNTDVRRTHRLIVGAAIGVVAVVGISTVAVNVHRVVGAHSAAAAPPVPLPDTSAPPPSQTPESAPPPIAESALPATAPDAALPANSAPAAASSSSSATAPKAVRPSAAPVARRSSSSDSIAASAPAAVATVAKPTAATAVVSAYRKIDTDLTATTPPATSAGNLQSSVTDAGTTTVNVAAARDAGSVGAATAAGGAAAQGSDEPAATAQARAAGGDSATSDRMITDAVQSQLDADTAGQGASLNVTTINGVVILKGTVPNAGVVEHAKQVAQQVRGVKGVDATAVKLPSP
jgi:hypothetical protein